MTISIATGLTDAEVAERVAEGKTNDVPPGRPAASRHRAGQRVHPINAILGVLFSWCWPPVR